MTWSGHNLLQPITINLFLQLEESRGRVEEKRAAVAAVAAEQVLSLSS